MSDGNYNDRQRAEATLHLAKRQLNEAREKGDPTAMLERNVTQLEQRYQSYKAR